MSDKVRCCAICHQPIDSERLQTQKDTHLCETHAKAITKFGGEFLTTGSTMNLKKEGSMKNAAEVLAAVSRKRNLEALERLRDEIDREKWEKEKKKGS